MDLSTDLPRPSGITGRASGRICCDPALGFAKMRACQAETITITGARCDVEPRQLSSTLPANDEPLLFSLLPSRCRHVAGESNIFEGAACAADMSANERDRFRDEYLKIQQDERIQLGRELHDSTGQLLLALRLGIAHLRHVRGTDAEDGVIDEIDDMAQKIDREVRAFAYTHYPAELGSDGLVAALQSLARGFGRRTGLDIRFNCPPGSNRPKGAAALALLRVAQEAIMNVHRHARASHVQISLALRGGMHELVVRDDGIGIASSHDIEKSHGVGLQGMRHRVERLAGHFAIRRLKHGTKVIASVPA